MMTNEEMRSMLSSAIAERDWLNAVNDIIIYEIKNGRAENEATINNIKEYLSINGMGLEVAAMTNLKAISNYIFEKICEIKKRMNSLYGQKADSLNDPYYRYLNR